MIARVHFQPSQGIAQQPHNRHVDRGQTNFKDLFSEALNEVNSALLDAEKTSAALAVGDVQDVHQAMLAVEKADLLLQLTIRVRNKAIEAYQEISRMQV